MFLPVADHNNKSLIFEREKISPIDEIINEICITETLLIDTEKNQLACKMT